MKVLYFSSVNWSWIKQRPHFVSYYMSLRGMKVDYFSITPLFKQKKSKKKYINEGLYIKDQYVLPLASKIKLIQYINKMYIRATLKRTSYETIILTHPLQYNYLSKRQKKYAQIIYECMDNMPFFYSGKFRKQIIEQEDILCHDCNKIITSSNYLKDKLMKEYGIEKKKITVIKNAVDVSFINQKVQEVELVHPNLMYIGTISEWVDIKSLNIFAESNPNYTIYLIGPIDAKVRQEINKLNYNIKCLGIIPHELIQSYILQGDVMLVPFKVSELIEGVDPVKVYEYLAMRKPIISAYWKEIDHYKENELVHFYNNSQEFGNQVEKALNSNNNSKIDFKFIRENSWETRMSDYIKVINTIYNDI